MKPNIFIISGKSPLGDSGGYPAYAHNLARVLTSLGYNVSIFAISETAGMKKTQFGTVYFSTTKLIRIFPMIRYIALAGLPYYSIIFYKTMKTVLQNSENKNCIIWGMGPWGFPGLILKLFPPPSTSILLFTSYFTSTRHEMLGAYNAIKVYDYGMTIKLKYFIVYHIIAPIFHLLEQMTLWYCDKIIVHYKSSKYIVQKYFRLPSTLQIIQFPWYIDVFSREGSQSNSLKNLPHPLIVSVCRQDPRKGLNFLIRAMKNVIAVYPHAHCLIVGSGEFLELNKKLVQKLDLEKNISVLGFVPDIRSILKEADIVVIVPLAQGSSALTVFEAMSYGKAIVASNCDGIPEDITDGKTGIIVNRGDEHDLARALTKLIKNPKLRKQLGTNAGRAYKKRFGFSKMKNDIGNFLKTVECNAHWLSK